MIVKRKGREREVVPKEIAEKEGVIHKDNSGAWRIISRKTNPPTFWPAHFKSEEAAKACLSGYHASKK